MKLSNTLAMSVAALLAGAGTPALAQSAGDWTLGVGAHQVAPKSDNGALVGNTLAVDVGNDIRPTITGEYFIADNVGIEVLAALPFEHDISIKGLGKIGSTKHLPPVVSLQYHFGHGNVKPFLGGGVNYTRFFQEESSLGELKLAGSWGLATHAGIDFKVSDKGSVRVDARWIDIDTDVKLDGAKIGTVNIDPLAYGVAYVMQF